MPSRCSMPATRAGVGQAASRAARPTGRRRPRSWRGRWRREPGGSAGSRRGKGCSSRPGGRPRRSPSTCRAACRWRTGRAPSSGMSSTSIGAPTRCGCGPSGSGRSPARRRLRISCARTPNLSWLKKMYQGNSAQIEAERDAERGDGRGRSRRLSSRLRRRLADGRAGRTAAAERAPRRLFGAPELRVASLPRRASVNLAPEARHSASPWLFRCRARSANGS